jgi:arylsulfatase A-like enzyme
MYGPDVRTPGTFARNCLIARRLAERGVKYQVLFGMGWDHHLAIKQSLPVRCHEIDQPAAALVMDLKQRGLLDDTLVMFGSEFGRTPFAQGQIDNPLVGRDHHGGCFTWWLAGAGVKAGLTHGETDDFSYNIVKDPVHIHDLNATLLHILGIDHERLTFRFQGRDYRLTDVHGKVVREVLA